MTTVNLPRRTLLRAAALGAAAALAGPAFAAPAPTVFAHLGVDIDPAWDLDGIPIE